MFDENHKRFLFQMTVKIIDDFVFLHQQWYHAFYFVSFSPYNNAIRSFFMDMDSGQSLNRVPINQSINQSFNQMEHITSSSSILSAKIRK